MKRSKIQKKNSNKIIETIQEVYVNYNPYRQPFINEIHQCNTEPNHNTTKKKKRDMEPILFLF